MTTTKGPAGQLTNRVREEIATRIARGELAAGSQLPTERELSDIFAVSRVTIRRAIASLTEDGLVYAIQGRGTFVSSGLLAEPPNALLSFHDMVAGESVLVGAQALRTGVRPATLTEAEMFGIAPGASLFELERLRTLDDLPVAIDLNLLPLALDPDLPTVDWSEESLYSRLEAAGHAPATADYVVEARAADEREAALLATSIGSPLLVAESQAFEGPDRMIVLGVISYRGDRYRFRSTLVAQPRPRLRLDTQRLTL